MDARSDLPRLPSAELYESIRQSLLDVGAAEGDLEGPWTPERPAEVDEWRRLARLAAKELGCRVRTYGILGGSAELVGWHATATTEQLAARERWNEERVANAVEHDRENRRRAQRNRGRSHLQLVTDQDDLPS